MGFRSVERVVVVLRAAACAAFVVAVLSFAQARAFACAGYSYWYSPETCVAYPKCTGTCKKVSSTAYLGTGCGFHLILPKCVCK